MSYKYGLLLPHFGRHASRDALIGVAPRIESLGFDSVWVRDHIIYHPHAFEDPVRTHLEPFVVLAAVAAVTQRVALGFGSLIPHRHPIYSALALASLEAIAGPGRVIAGWGLGTFDHEFAALGLGEYDRRIMVEEQVKIMRKLWQGEVEVYEGEIYGFADVDIYPRPAHGTIPIWYCGNSPAAVRRTIEWELEGWMPGRITHGGFVQRLARLRRIQEQHKAPSPEIAAIPLTAPGKSFDAAAAEVNVAPMLEEARRKEWVPGESGVFETARDLAGVLICGNADDIAEQVSAYQAVGLSHLVFDLRSRFGAWADHVEFLGAEVLPRLSK